MMEILSIRLHIQNTKLAKHILSHWGGEIQKEEVESLKKGVDLGDYVTRPAEVKILKIDKEKNISRLEIKIHEGKNRQVRKMCEAIGKKVIALHRSQIGEINVKDLKMGTWRYLKKSEIETILKTRK